MLTSLITRHQFDAMQHKKMAKEKQKIRWRYSRFLFSIAIVVRILNSFSRIQIHTHTLLHIRIFSMFEGVDKRNGIAKTKEENCVEYHTHILRERV